VTLDSTADHTDENGSSDKFDFISRQLEEREGIRRKFKVRWKAWPLLRTRCSGEAFLRPRSGQASPGRRGDRSPIGPIAVAVRLGIEPIGKFFQLVCGDLSITNSIKQMIE